MARVIYDTRDLDLASEEMLKNIDSALIAAAYRIRDDMRDSFRRDAAGAYNHTGDINKLAEGILVGKLRNSTVKVHALGSNSNPDTYKTRFFVGGTIYRKQTQIKGKSIKPYSKGYIKSLDSVEKGMQNAESILNKYINNVL